jgi:hypothetical protein
LKNRAIRIKKRDAWDALCGDFNERRLSSLAIHQQNAGKSSISSTRRKDNARDRTLFVLSIDGKGESKLIDTPGVHPHGWTNPAASLQKIVREFALSVPTIRSS